jgi:chromosome segregation ATPase
MRMSSLGSPRTASIVGALIVLALVPIVLVAVLGIDRDADGPTPAVSSTQDTDAGGPEALVALERRVMVLENRDERRSDELETLRQDLDAVTTALTELDEADLPEALAATDEQLAALIDGLTVLDEELTVIGDAVAGQGAELEATAAELRGGIGEVRSGISELRGEIDRTGGNVEVLRGEVATLRDRLDRIQRGG